MERLWEDVEHTTRARWLKWGPEVFCDQHIAARLKRTLHNNDYTSYDLWSKMLTVRKQYMLIECTKDENFKMW